MIEIVITGFFGRSFFLHVPIVDLMSLSFLLHTALHRLTALIVIVVHLTLHPRGLLLEFLQGLALEEALLRLGPVEVIRLLRGRRQRRPQRRHDLWGQALGVLHVEGDDKVAALCRRLPYGKALARNHAHVTGLDDLPLCVDDQLAAVEMRHRKLVAAQRLRKRETDVQQEVVLVADEDRVLLDGDGYDDRARVRRGVGVLVALPVEGDLLAVDHPLLNVDLESDFLRNHTVAAARRALVRSANNVSGAVAHAALDLHLLHHGPHLHHADLDAATTARVARRLRVRVLCPFTVALAAHNLTRVGNDNAVTAVDLLERDGERHLGVRYASPAAATSAAAHTAHAPHTHAPHHATAKHLGKHFFIHEHFLVRFFVFEKKKERKVNQ
eukprot:PhM_4_TR19054/c1_g1_i2/m.3193